MLVQRPLSVVALVPRLAARGAVPDDQHRLRVGGQLREAAQHLSVVRVLQLASSRRRRAATRARRPPQFGLNSPPTLRAAQYRTFLMPCSTDSSPRRGAGRDAHGSPVSSSHLAHRGDRFGFAGVDLALGQRPVVVSGTVDDRDLRRRRVTAGSPQHSAGRENGLARRDRVGVRSSSAPQLLQVIRGPAKSSQPTDRHGCRRRSISDTWWSRTVCTLAAATPSSGRRCRAPSTGWPGPARTRRRRSAARSASDP